MTLLFAVFLALILGFFMKILRFFVEKKFMKTVDQYNLKTYILSDLWNLTYPLVLGSLICLASYGMSQFFSSYLIAFFKGGMVQGLQAMPLSMWVHDHSASFVSLGMSGFFASGMIIIFGTIHRVIRYFGYAMIGLTMFALSSLVVFHTIAFGA